MKRLALAAVLGCFLLSWQGEALAAPGDIDPSFGAGGIVETPQVLRQGHLREIALGEAIGPRDEIFVLGFVPQNCPSKCPFDLEVTRYSRDGSLDRSFGGGGRVLLTVDPGQGLRMAASIAVGADGKPVIATTAESDITLLRLARGGALDPTFGGTGIVSSRFPGPDQAAGVAVQGDGKVVVAGVRETALEGTQPLLIRYTPGGNLDGGFGEGGVRVLGFAAENYPAGLSLVGKQQAAVGLSDCCYATGRALVARLTVAGSLDRRFSHQGWRAIGQLAPVRVEAVMPAPRGKLLVAGASSKGLFLARFLADGRSDDSFGKRGLSFPRFPLDHPRFSAIGTDRLGRALIASMDRNPDEYSLARLRFNGHLDRTFAGGNAGGIPSITRTQSIAQQSNGRVVVLAEGGGCERTCPPSRMILVRYLGGSSDARCAGRRATIVGTRRAERLEGTQHRDVIAGLGGQDRIFGFGGNDLICGGGGNDRLFGGPGRDRLLGGPGRNALHQ